MRLCHDELQKNNEFTKSMDLMTYNSAYLMGMGQPRYQLPAIPRWFEWRAITVIHIWEGERKEVWLFEQGASHAA